MARQTDYRKNKDGDMIYIIAASNRTQEASEINITRLYGRGNEPTKEQLDCWNERARQISKENPEKVYPDMQKLYGEKKGRTCEECFWFEVWDYRGRRYFKCRKRGMSHSTASDIRKSATACGKFKEEEGETK